MVPAERIELSSDNYKLPVLAIELHGIIYARGSNTAHQLYRGLCDSHRIQHRLYGREGVRYHEAIADV